MSRSILFLFLGGVLTFMSCRFEKEISVVHYSFLDNKTDKEILYFVNTEVGVDSIHSNGQDLGVMSFEKTSRFNIPLLGGERIFDKYAELSIMSYTLYDLADTLTYQRVGGDEVDSIFLSKMGHLLYSDEVYYQISSDTLTVDDELLRILKKDYSMLERFPEFYSR